VTCKTEITVSVLLDEETPDFLPYVELLHNLFTEIGRPFEILIIANGTQRYLKRQLEKLDKDLTGLKACGFNSRVPSAVCIKTTLQESCSEVIVACGSYQQISANSIKALVKALDESADLVVPWRQHRVDPSLNQFQSRGFNAMVKAMTGIQLHDMSCTIRVFRRSVLENVRFYGNLYRFLPILARLKGYNIIELPCDHHQERGKTGLYSSAEYVTRLLDIITLYFNLHFSRKPLRFFSAIGFAFLSGGLLIAIWITLQRIFMTIPIGNRFELLAAVFLMVLGITVAGLGLLGEIIAFALGRQRKEYTIEKII
jgi:hypothetical protein